MSMHTLKSKIVKQFGKTIEQAAHDQAPPPHESKKAKAWSTAREPLEKKERAVRDATTKQGLIDAMKAMAIAQKAFDKVYRAHEKAGG